MNAKSSRSVFFDLIIDFEGFNKGLETMNPARAIISIQISKLGNEKRCVSASISPTAPRGSRPDRITRKKVSVNESSEGHSLYLTAAETRAHPVTEMIENNVIVSIAISIKVFSAICLECPGIYLSS